MQITVNNDNDNDIIMKIHQSSPKHATNYLISSPKINNKNQYSMSNKNEFDIARDTRTQSSSNYSTYIRWKSNNTAND